MNLPTKIHTLAEAADRLRVTRHGLAKVARRTGHCAQMGRKLLFSEADLDALWQELRVPPAGSHNLVMSLHEIDISRRAAEFLAKKPKRATR